MVAARDQGPWVTLAVEPDLIEEIVSLAFFSIVDLAFFLAVW